MANKYYTVEKKKTENGESLIFNINNHITLYKYQSFSDHSINALINDEIWLTSPLFFNDPYDMICTFDENKIRKLIKSSIKNMPIEIKERDYKSKTNKEIENFLFNDIIDKIQVRKLLYVGCYTVDPTNEIMWSHYADCGKGFELAYDSNELIEACEKTNQICIENAIKFLNLHLDFEDIKSTIPSTIIPVQYCNNKLDITNDFLKYTKKCLDLFKDFNSNIDILKVKEIYDEALEESITNLNKTNSDFYKMILYKKPGWKYEQELRIWIYNIQCFQNFPKHFKLYTKVKPKYIILGENVSLYNEKLMITIAKEKKIPIYKINNQITKGKCKLNFFLLSDN